MTDMTERLTDEALEQVIEALEPRQGQHVPIGASFALDMARELLERRRATPADDLRAAAIKAAVEEYDLPRALDDADLMQGRRCAVRGMMVRLGLYSDFNAALAQKDRADD